MRSLHLLAAGLVVAAIGLSQVTHAQQPAPGIAPRAADHEAWRGALDAVQSAVAARDLAAARAQVRLALREASFFEMDDPRNQQTIEAILPFNQLLLASSPRDALGLYASIVASFDADGRGSSWIALQSRASLAALYAQQGDPRRAEVAFREQRDRANPDGPAFVHWLVAMIGLGRAELALGKREQALATAREAEERASRRFGPEHVAVFQARALQATALREAGRSDEAVAAYESLKKVGPRLPAGHAGELTMLRFDYGTFLMEICRFDEAKTELQAGIDGLIAMAGPAIPEVAVALQRLAKTEMLRGDWLAAQPIAQRAVRAMEDSARRPAAAADAKTPERVIESQVLLADIYLAVQRNGDAKTMLARAGEVLRRSPNPSHEADLRSRDAEVEAALGAEARARSLAEESLKLAGTSQVAPLAAADVRVRIAEVALRRGDFAAAESLSEQALPVIEKSVAPEERRLRALHALARAQEGLGKSEAALATIERARQVSAKCFGASSPRLAPLAATETALLAKLGRDAELSASRTRLDQMERARRDAPGNQSPEVARLEDAAMNVSFVQPGPEWIEVPREARAETHDVRALRRADPVMTIVLQAHAVDGPADLTDAEIRAHAFDYSKKEAEGARMREIVRTPRVIAGVEGSQASEEWTLGARKELRVRWVGVRGGWQYSLLIVSDQASLETLVAEAKRDFEGFSPLDPSRVAARTPVKRSYRSERFGYSFDVSDYHMAVADRALAPKRVEVIALQERRDDVSVNLYVIPVVLGSAARDPEIVQAALLDLVQPLVRAWGDSRVVDGFGARGRELDGRYEYGGRASHVRARIFQRGGVGWAIAVSVDGLPESAVEAQLRAVSAVKLAAIAPPDPSSWTESERLRHALLQNSLGLAYASANQPTRAIESFQRSLELGPGAMTVVENLAQTQLDAGRFREAVRGLDAPLLAEPDRVSLLAFRGVALRRMGSTAAAERDLRRAVENGHASPVVYGEWLGTLFELRRGEEALAVAGRRLEQTGSVDDRVTRAFVLLRLGRSDEAVAELSVVAREHPEDAAVQQLLLGAALMSKDPQSLLAATDRLLEAGGPGPLLLVLRGAALRELRRYDEALASLDQALALAPDAVEIRELRDRVERERSAAAGRRT